MSAKYKDFDAMFSEMKVETIPFKVFGKVYEIKKQAPALLVLELSRHEGNEALTNELIIKAGRQIFGDEILDELCSKSGFSVNMLSEMIKWAFEAINGKEEPEPEEITEDDVEDCERKN